MNKVTFNLHMLITTLTYVLTCKRTQVPTYTRNTDSTETASNIDWFDFTVNNDNQIERHDTKINSY